MIAQRAVRGAAIMLFSSYANLAMGFITTIVLTRLLPPTVFGLFALGMFFYSIVDLRNKFSLDYALIYRQPTTDEIAATHWLLQIMLAGISLLIGFVASWLLPFIGYSADVSPILLSLCGIGAIEAAGSTARALLEKELRFGRSTIISSSALLLSNLTAVALAWLGAGVWSLVAQFGVTALIGSIGFWRLTPTRPRLIFSPPIARWMLRFGLTLVPGSIATLILLQGDNFMVGTFVSVAMLGFYERAYRVAQWPTGLVTHIISRAAMPTYARLQADKPRLSKAFGLTLWVIISVATPLALSLFVSAPDLILLIFGEVWAPSGLLLRFLVGYSVLRPLIDDVGMLLMATGNPQRVTQLLIAQATALVVFALPLTLVYGAVGTAIGVGLTFLVGIMLAYRFVSELVSLDWGTMFGPPLIVLVTTLSLYWGLTQIFDLNALPVLARVIMKSAFVLLVFMGMLVVIQRETTERLRYVWRLLRES